MAESVKAKFLPAICESVVRPDGVRIRRALPDDVLIRNIDEWKEKSQLASDPFLARFYEQIRQGAVENSRKKHDDQPASVSENAPVV